MGNLFANAEVVFYCAEELETGIVKNKKTGVWELAPLRGLFVPSSVWGRNPLLLERHTIKFSDNYTKLDGLDSFTWNCQSPYSGFTLTMMTQSQKEVLSSLRICNPPYNNGDTFSFSKLSLRFLSI